MALNIETEVNWQDYATIIIRRRWFFIVPCVTIVAGAMLVGLMLPKMYRSETTLLIQDPKIMNPLIRGMAVASPVEQRMRIVQQELLGWTSLTRLATELGLDKDAKTPLALERRIGDIKHRIRVSAGKGGSLVRLTFESPSPALAQRVLNTITDIYIRRNFESQTAEAETAIRFIDSEMAVYKTKLEESERALREFKELNAMEMPVASRLNAQIISLEVQLAQLLVESTEEHPTVIQVKRRIQELKQKRNEEIKKVIALTVTRSQNPEIYGDLAAALEMSDDAGKPMTPEMKTAKEAYRGWVDRLDNAAVAEGPQRQVVEVVQPSADPDNQPLDVVMDGGGLSVTLAPRQEQELARLRRDYEIHRKTYQEMKQRLERAKITQRLGESDEGTKFKIIEPARLPLTPFSPDLWGLFYAALAAGLFIGVCAAFTVEYLDHSFQSAEDVHSALALPVIGSISTIVTPGDIAARQRWVKNRISNWTELRRFQMNIWRPVMSRIDQVLLRWGL